MVQLKTVNGVVFCLAALERTLDLDPADQRVVHLAAVEFGDRVDRCMCSAADALDSGDHDGAHVRGGGGIGECIDQRGPTPVRDMPLESLLLETDAPDMPLQGQQGAPNTPANLPKIAQLLADLQASAKVTALDIQLF